MRFLAANYNFFLVLIGVGLLGATAGVIGCFAVLRRRSLTGDALAHGALPGLCLAFFIVGERSLPALLLGALASGILGIGVITLLRRWTRIKEDAAIGVVLSVFFGVGVVLLSVAARVDGGSRAGLESFILGKTAGMIREDVIWIAILGGATLASLLLLYKEFKLVAFDAAFAQAQGWPAYALDFLLMLLIAVAVVIGLPAVGVLLMAALLVIPAAAARFWTERLGIMLALSAAIGLVSGWLGTLASNFLDLPAGPAVILACTAIFLGSLLLAPRRGILARMLQRRRNQRDLEQQQLLRVLYALVEPGLPHVAALSSRQLTEAGMPPPTLSRLLREAEQAGDVVREGETYALTPQGLEHAAAATRNQRLWKLFFEEHPDLAPALIQMHLPPLDDLVTPAQMGELARKLRTREATP